MNPEPVVDIEGLVYVDDWDVEHKVEDHITIDELVARAVEPKMLEDEPEAEQLLLRFKQRLITALEHVNAALQSVSSPR